MFYPGYNVLIYDFLTGISNTAEEIEESRDIGSNPN